MKSKAKPVAMEKRETGQVGAGEVALLALLSMSVQRLRNFYSRFIDLSWPAQVLTGHDTSPASDLWALGCILYQMVTGMCPFVSQTEYLIFQKIQALDYTFPEGFDSRVKDLVTRLLVIDPERRLGALESRSGYTSIKNHSFFEGVDFSTLHLSTPPGVEVSSLRDSKDPVWAKYPDMMPGLGAGALDRMLRYEMEDGRDSDSGSDNGGDDVESEAGSEIGDIGNIGDLSDEERLRLLDLQKQNNEYHRFVDGNLILKQGILDKKKGLWSRRRMFLLTEGPKLFYVDPKEKVLKGEIPWSADMKTEMKDFRCSFHRKQHEPKTQFAGYSSSTPLAESTTLLTLPLLPRSGARQLKVLGTSTFPTHRPQSLVINCLVMLCNEGV